MTQDNKRQLQNQHILIDTLDNEFRSLHQRSMEQLDKIPAESIYSRSQQGDSFGENFLRGAAIVEQSFGGLLSNLWDDPFEWTLPETLSTKEKIAEYLWEVEATRQKVFAGLAADEDLFKDVALPSDSIQPLVTVLVATLVRACNYEGRALKVLNSFSQ